MTIQNLPRKVYRLRDGAMGTEYEALLESIKWHEAERQLLEDKIEELRARLALAEGSPP